MRNSLQSVWSMAQIMSAMTVACERFIYLFIILTSLTLISKKKHPGGGPETSDQFG